MPPLRAGKEDTMDDLNHQAGSARLLNMPGRRDQMLRAMLLVLNNVKHKSTV